MKIYVQFSANGRVVGFWSDDLFPDIVEELAEPEPVEEGEEPPEPVEPQRWRNPKIPEDAFEIDEETHRALHEFPDRWRLIDGVITEYSPPAPTQEEIRQRMLPLSARQLRIGLITNGIALSQVTATINAMPEGQAKEIAQVEWEFATTFNRMHPLIISVGAALGLTEAQIDSMWLGALEV